MNLFVTVRADYQSLAPSLFHETDPFVIALQVFELLNLMNFQLVTAFPTQFADIPLHPLFQCIGFVVFPELWQFIDLICLVRCIFSCKTAPVESGGLPARPRIVCNREISVLVVSASDFMHIGLVLACKCFEHLVQLNLFVLKWIGQQPLSLSTL